MKRRILSLLLCMAMLFQYLPAQADAADGIEITEIRFYSNSDSSEYVLLSDTDETVEVDYTKGQYRFEIGFNSPSAVSHVHIVATAGEESKSLGASYDTQAGYFVTEGYFDSSNTTWAPETLEFRYAKKSTAPAVGSSVDWVQLRGYLGSVGNAVVTETTEGSTTTGTVDMSATVDTLKNLDMSYCVKTVDAAMGSDLGTMRDYYQNGQNVLAYVVPGIDDSRYYAYLDYSDPNSVKMLIDDGMDAAGTAIEVALEFLDESSGTAQSLESVSQSLSEAGSVADVLMESYCIHHEMDDLRKEIETSAHIQDKVTATEAVNQLEADQIAFTVLAYMLPVIATGGAAGIAGAAGMVLTGMINVMSKAADWVYEQRIGAITGETVRTEQFSQSGMVYWEGSTSHYVEYDPGSHTMRVTDDPRGTYYYETEAMKQGYKVWVEVQKEYLVNTSRFVYDAGISEQNSPMPPNVSEIVFNSTGDIFVAGGYDGDNIVDLGGPKLPNLERIGVPEGVKRFGFDNDDCISLQTISLPSTIEYLQVEKSDSTEITPRPLVLVMYAGNMSQWDEVENSAHYEAVYTIHMTPSGWHGDNVDWVFDPETQTLTITGQGDIADKGYEENYPWFRINDDVKKIVVEEGITGIPNRIFEGLPALEEVTLPGTLTSLGESAFQNCSTLKTVVIREGIVEIPKYCFDGCTSLEAISLPEGLKTVGNYAFRGCGLKTIEIPFGVTKLTGYCFQDCAALTTATVPYTVQSVSALQHCSALSKVYYGSSKTAWEKRGGDKIAADVEFTPEGICEDNLTWRLNEETGVLTISGTGAMNNYGDYSISGWTWPNWYDYRNQIRQVVVEEGITAIGQMAFGASSNEEMYFPGEKLDYPKLTEISLPDTVEYIHDYAFSRCSALKSIRIPASVLYINSHAFADLPKLDQIWFQGDAPQIDWSSFLNVSGTAYYPAENATWTEEIVQNYQKDNKELIWRPNCKGGCTLVVSEAVEPTCTKNGFSEGSYCSVCGVIQQAQTVIPATGHSFGEWYVVSEVEQRRDCANCSDQDVKLIHDGADFNQDGEVSAADALLILWNVMDPEAYPLAGNGDINGDGSVNDADAQYLIWFTLFPSIFKIP